MNLNRYLSPLLARDRNEKERTATPLELLFDLVVVIAIAAAAHGLAHALDTGDILRGIIHFVMAFFAIWWPWNLVTWFASSFDNDDVAYRINIMVMMFGAMFIAASLPTIFANGVTVFSFIGYIIIRLALTFLWFRAARANEHLRQTAWRYVVGQLAMQGFWAFIIFGIPPTNPIVFVFFAIGALGELFIPWYAEKAGETPWHRQHLIERFGLLNIIVLGEALLASTHAIQANIKYGIHPSLIILAGSGVVMVFSMWWLYFCEEEHLDDESNIARSLLWGYGHFLVFASGAAVGAGFTVMVETLKHAMEAGEHLGEGLQLSMPSFAISIPLGLYVLGVWLVRDRYKLHQIHHTILLFFAVLIALSGWLPHPPIPATILLVLCLIIRLRSQPKPMTSE